MNTPFWNDEPVIKRWSQERRRRDSYYYRKPAARKSDDYKLLEQLHSEQRHTKHPDLPVLPSREPQIQLCTLKSPQTYFPKNNSTPYRNGQSPPLHQADRYSREAKGNTEQTSMVAGQWLIEKYPLPRQQRDHEILLSAMFGWRCLETGPEDLPWKSNWEENWWFYTQQEIHQESDNRAWRLCWEFWVCAQALGE